MTAVLPGSLLVATHELLDPTFAESVVLILDVDTDGALGVILNHPTTVAVDQVLPDWGGESSTPPMLFSGGPVGPDGAVAVARLADAHDQPVGWRSVFGDVGMVDLDTPLELVAGGYRALRIYAGYSGWGAGQLEAEIAEGSWYVLPAEPGDAFGADTTDLRREVLRRQPGELAWRSTRPSDPGLN